MRRMLAKRCDRVQQLAGGRQLPVHQELGLMLGRPFDRQTQRSRRQPPFAGSLTLLAGGVV